MNDYYVYVYIDPRNNEEFYFGKGRGSRKNAHLSDGSDNEKAQRIAAILDAGVKPVIRVIARDLSEHDAFLIEKTLLWKLGHQLTNVSSGYFAEKFRPKNTLHVDLMGYDFQNGLYYFNVGEGPHRNWDDYKEFGFISAGQGVRWRDAILGFSCGDIIAAYLKNHGFVGIGQITMPARPIRFVAVGGKPVLGHALICGGMADNIESDELCEHVCMVEWKRAVNRVDAKWEPKSKLFSTSLVRASLEGQPETIKFLEREFEISLRELLT